MVFFLKRVFVVLLVMVGVLFLSAAAQAGSFSHFVVAQDVVTKEVNWDMRFCERKNLRGLVCGRNAKVFGREHFLVQDWWYPETYVEARTGIPAASIDIVGVQPTADGRGIVIYYEPKLEGR